MATTPVKIILIEDSVEDARLVQLMLARVGKSKASRLKFDLTHVDHLEEGIKRLSSQPFELILLDLSLPDSNGFETFSQVYTLASNVPIVVLSGFDDEDLAVKAVNAGAQDYLVKGQIAPELLARSIRHSIERHRMRMDLEKYIAERKQAEAALQKAKEELELIVRARTRELRLALEESEQRGDRIDAILKSVADGLIVTDLHTRVAMMNHSAENILGIALADVLNQPIDRAISNEVLREKIKATLHDKSYGYQFDFSVPLKRLSPLSKVGGFQTIRARTAVIQDKAQQASGVITIMYDVTGERELDRAKAEFISTAAHELRTPLTSIQGFSEIIFHRDNLGAETRKKYVSHIYNQSLILAKIVDDLLDISRIETGETLELQKTLCSIEATIKQVIQDYTEAAGRIKLVLADKPSEWVVDKGKIQQVLRNLLSNAAKYSPADSVIQITGRALKDIQSDKRFYQVSIQDTGVGMTPEQVARIFDKFYRVDASNTATSGIGLGMAIVQNIIELHSGRIWVDSKLDEGTTVSFTLPL